VRHAVARKSASASTIPPFRRQNGRHLVYEDDVLDTVRAQLATFDGVLVDARSFRPLWHPMMARGAEPGRVSGLTRSLRTSGVM
jgi:hypothetical protein